MTRGLFLAGAMVVGCNAIFGIDELEMSDPPHQGGAASTVANPAASRASTSVSSNAHSGGADDCERCAEDNGCVAEQVACATNPQCILLDECLELCDDSICRTDCLEMYASAIETLYAQYDCERCTGPCGQLCECDGCGITDCVECVSSGCVQTSCSELWNACAMNNDCTDLVGCINGCMGDPSCEDLCANTHPVGSPILQDLLRCAQCSWNTCYDACGGSMACAP